MVALAWAPSHMAPGPAVGTTGESVQTTQGSLQPGISSLSFTGEGVATVENGRTYVWMDGSTRLFVLVQPFDVNQTHQVCLTATEDRQNASEANQTTTPDGEGDTRQVVRRYGCQTTESGSADTQLTFDLPTLRLNETGQYRLDVTVAGGNQSDTSSLPIFVLNRSDDLDGDGLPNEAEVKHGTDINGSDTDGDGLQDGPEVHDYETDPINPDTDGDRVRDAVEINEGSEPTKPDTDGDGLGDYEEINEYDTDPAKPDTDGDGFDDGEEVAADTNPLDPTSHPPTGPVDSLVRAVTLTVSNPWTWALVILLFGVSAAIYARREEWPLFVFDRTAVPPADDSGGGPPPGSAGGPGGEQEDLLPPDERVERLLTDHGGRLKQSEFVELTGWSKAKVSRVLSRMEESGEIDRRRIGRENVVSHPGEDIESESPGQD